MTKNRLGSVCGALPWKLDIRSSTYAGIRNAQNEPTGIVLMSTGTPPQKAAMNYIVQCANLMPETVAIIKDLCDAAMAADSSIRGLEMTEKVIQRAEALLAKLEGGAEDERD